MMTDDQIASIEARLKSAARAPWTLTRETYLRGAVVWAHDGDRVATVDGGQVCEIDPGRMAEADDNATFIAHAPEDIVSLLAERATLLEIVQAIARATVITSHAPYPDYLCPHYTDGKAWPLRAKAREALGLTWLERPQERKP